MRGEGVSEEGGSEEGGSDGSRGEVMEGLAMGC